MDNINYNGDHIANNIKGKIDSVNHQITTNPASDISTLNLCRGRSRNKVSHIDHYNSKGEISPGNCVPYIKDLTINQLRVKIIYYIMYNFSELTYEHAR